MENMNIQIQYLFNSGFSIETQNYQLIFDYYKGPLELGDKRIIVFSSHGHPDHYNSKVLKWRGESKNINYIFSDDITIKEPDKSMHFVSVDEEIEVNNIKIRTFGSTDLGVSFLVKADGINIFHAGDLNWWYWWDDTLDEIRTMEEAFKKKIKKLHGEKVDIAFFPVDPRLKHNYSLGGEYFIKEIKPSVFIPMHFGEDYGAIKSFAEKVKEYYSEVIEITAKGQKIHL
ncbi:MAG: MBL fold metallo-hydrolase [Lutispora sp.]|nr:MBL fold metallo-hydrolase [Lutispora sp.]MDD4833827.1 MBL fold metallo-hydrolase [Lutispora sp.]